MFRFNGCLAISLLSCFLFWRLYTPLKSMAAQHISFHFSLSLATSLKWSVIVPSNCLKSFLLLSIYLCFGLSIRRSPSLEWLVLGRHLLSTLTSSCDHVSLLCLGFQLQSIIFLINLVVRSNRSTFVFHQFSFFSPSILLRNVLSVTTNFYSSSTLSICYYVPIIISSPLVAGPVPHITLVCSIILKCIKEF